MRKLLLTIMFLFAVSGTAFSAALTESGDTRAVPMSLYGTESNGDITAFKVDSDGALYVSGNFSNGLTVTGNVSISENLTIAGYYYGDATYMTGVAASPAGNDTHIQYNNGGIAGGAAGLTYDDVLKNLSVSNDLTVVNDCFADAFFGSGAGLTGVVASASPGGSDTQIQYNDGGSMGGIATFTYDKTNGALDIAAGLTINGNLTVLENLTVEGYYYGDGSKLSSIPSDGDKGDITVSASGATWNIDADVVTKTEIVDSWINSLAADTLASGDEFVFYDTTGGTSDKITWSNLMSSITSVGTLTSLTVGSPIVNGDSNVLADVSTTLAWAVDTPNSMSSRDAFPITGPGFDEFTYEYNRIDSVSDTDDVEYWIKVIDQYNTTDVRQNLHVNIQTDGTNLYSDLSLDSALSVSPGLMIIIDYDDTDDPDGIGHRLSGVKHL